MADTGGASDKVLVSTSSRSNFQRIVRLLISGGTHVAQGVLDKILPQAALASELADPVTQLRLGRAKLTNPQWKTLYPSPGTYGKSEDFDISLLCKVFRNVCSLTPPTTGWDSLPCASDLSLEADLVRLKIYRNSVYGHVNKKMEISDCKFIQLWNDISDCVTRLAAYISHNEEEKMKKEIKEFLVAPLCSEHERNLVELQAWYIQDTETKQELLEMKKTLDMLTLAMARVDIQETDTKQQLTEMKNTLELLTSAIVRIDTEPATDECLQPFHKGLCDQFCEECQDFVCETCVLFYHRQHTTISMKSSAQMQTIRVEVDGFVEKIQKDIPKWEHEAALLENTRASTEQEIKTLEKSTDVEFALSEVHQTFDRQLQRIHEHISHLKTVLQFCQKVARGTRLELLRNKKFVKQKVEELLEYHEQQPKTLVPCLILGNTNCCGSRIIEVAISSSGLFEAAVGEEKVLTMKASRLCCYTRRECYEVLDIMGKLKPLMEDSVGATLPVNVVPNKDGTYVLSYTPLNHGKHKLTIHIDNKPVCCPIEVIVSPKKYVVARTISHRCEGMDLFHRPHGVTTTSKADIVICECQNKTATVINKNGKLIRSFDFGEGFFPKGIACCKDGRFIVSGENQIRIFDKDGNFIKLFGSHGTKNGDLNCPCDISVDNNDNIIVADTDNNRIQVFSANGDFLLAFGQGKLNHPWSCVRYENTFFVSDTRNHCIRAFDEKGNFLFKFGEEGQDAGQFQYPRGISVDYSGNILICDTENDRIQSFTSSGDFLTEFDSRGNEAGQFNGPCNLCFSRDGLLIITDCGTTECRCSNEI